MPPAAYPTARQQFTGSEAHNRRLEELAAKAGLVPANRFVFFPEGQVAVADEADLYRLCGLPSLSPS